MGKSCKILFLAASILLGGIICRAFSQTQSGGDSWFRQSHAFRLILCTDSVQVSKTGYVEFLSGGRCANNGRDILISDDKGRIVKSRIISIGPGDRFLVAFTMTDSLRYHLYMGSLASFAAPSNWYPQAGLLLKTYRRPEGSSGKVNEILDMVKRASVLDGTGYRETVFDGFNPFGKSDDYIAIYTGYLDIAEDAVYDFATNSDDSSLLFIDDKLVADFAGLHGPFAVFGEKNGKIALRKGIHRLNYYHVEYQGGQAAVAGWKRPGDKYFSLIPARAFVPIARATVERLESKNGAIPDFDFSFGEIYAINEESALFEMRFRQFSMPDENIKAHKWSFGDGEFSNDDKPNHIYAAPGIYNVTLSVKDEQDKTFYSTHRVQVFANDGALTGNPEETGKRFPNLMAQYNFTSASLPALKSLILFFSSETAPNAEKTVLLCSLALKQIPESESEARAPLLLKMADTMRDTPRLGDYLVRKRLYESIIRDASKPEYIANAAYELGDIELFFTRSFAAALALYNKALENTANPALKRLVLIRIGDTYLYSGKISEAKQAYINVPPLRNDKKSENILRTAYGQYIESYMRENKYENALDALNTWEWEYPDVKLDGYSFLLRIRINYKLGKLDEVTKYAYYILNVLEEESYKPETYYILISLLLKDNKKESALPYFEKMKDAFPNNYYMKMLLPFFE